MFRVVSFQAVLRILFVCVGLVASGAVAQDQPAQKPADKPANHATSSPAAPVVAQTQATSSEQPTAGQTQPAQAKPAAEADPLKRPTDAKQKKKNERALKQELS